MFAEVLWYTQQDFNSTAKVKAACECAWSAVVGGGWVTQMYFACTAEICSSDTIHLIDFITPIIFKPIVII